MTMSQRSFGKASPDSTTAVAPCYSAKQPRLIITHRFVFIALGLFLLSLDLIGIQLNPLDAPVLTALVILILGVPHGAFDVALWKSVRGLSSRQDLKLLLAKYVFLAATFFILWLIVPELVLPLFIVMSVYHFSGDWSEDLDFAPRLIVASAMLTAPAGLFREEVAQIFSWFAPKDTAIAVATIMAVLSVPLLQASVIPIVLLVKNRSWLAAELVVILSLAWLTPPLLFFVIYFCGLHSVRHMIETREQLRCRTPRELLFAAWPYAPLAIVGTLLGAVMLSSLPLGPAMLGMVFVALGSLTVPHIILIEALRGGSAR